MHASRPLVGLLIGTVVFFALWMTALKPSSSGNANSQGLGQYQPSINKACDVPGLSHPVGCGPSGSKPTSTTAGHATPPAGPAGASATGAKASAGSASGVRSHAPQKSGTNAHPTATPKAGFGAVEAGLSEHKVLALLFYNPAAADDKAVRQELSSVPTHHGAVVKVAVPLQDLSRYATLLNEVPVNFSPTLVLINRARQAEEIAGFADAFEIDQRVVDALSSKS